MPSNKILIILIICIGIVASVWIFDKSGVKPEEKAGVISYEPRPSVEPSGDWKKILNQRVASTTTTIITNNAPYSGEGTLTDQMAKDFFSQYLIAQKDQGGTLTDEQVTAIADNTLANPSYTTAEGPKYTALNLHISSNSSTQTVANYYADMRGLGRFTVPDNTPSEIDILTKAIKSEKESDLNGLDPIILSYRSILTALLDMNVPADAIQVHLQSVNAVSNVLANIEAMKLAFTDPVKTFAAVSDYYDHGLELSMAIKAVMKYFEAKGYAAQ